MNRDDKFLLFMIYFRCDFQNYRYIDHKSKMKNSLAFWFCFNFDFLLSKM